MLTGFSLRLKRHSMRKKSPQQSQESQYPCRERDEYEVLRYDVKKRLAAHLHQAMGACCVHTKGEDSAPINNIVRERYLSNDMSPYTQYHQQRNPPSCRGPKE